MSYCLTTTSSICSCPCSTPLGTSAPHYVHTHTWTHLAYVFAPVCSSSDRKNLICDPFPRDFITDTVKRHDEVVRVFFFLSADDDDDDADSSVSQIMQQNCINCLEGIHELMEFKTDERALRVFLEKKVKQTKAPLYPSHSLYTDAMWPTHRIHFCTDSSVGSCPPTAHSSRRSIRTWCLTLLLL
jgi:hypothetical protein